MVDVEEWRVIAGFEHYAVSSHGRVKRVTPGLRNQKCRILTPHTGNHGYAVVGLTKDRRAHKKLVHRLVCEAFHGPAPSERHEVAHGDGTRTNHRADNLRWATRSENMADCLVHGTQVHGARHFSRARPDLVARGERHGAAKIDADIVRAIRASARSKGSGVALATQFGLSTAAVSLIRNGKIWKHVS